MFISHNRSQGAFDLVGISKEQMMALFRAICHEKFRSKARQADSRLSEESRAAEQLNFELLQSLHSKLIAHEGDYAQPKAVAIH